jgi:prenyl protein peptidase
MDSVVAVLLSLAYGILYVVFFYYPKSKELRGLSRDHVQVIRHRIRAVTVASVLSIGTCGVLISVYRPEESAWTMLGFRSLFAVETYLAMVLPVALTLVFFLGPFMADIVDMARHGLTLRWNLLTLRALVIAPITEEVVFRACIATTLLLADYSHTFIVWVAPLFFGTAHVHHIIELYAHKQAQYGTVTRQQLIGILLPTVFQFAYTFLFGVYAMHIFLQTGCLYGVILVHALCNHFGLPDVGHLSSVPLIMAYVGGPLLFVASLSSVLDSSHFS